MARSLCESAAGGKDLRAFESSTAYSSSGLTRQGIKQAFEEVVFKILDTPSLIQSGSKISESSFP